MTPKVIFKFNKEKDLRNIWETANSKILYGYDFKKNLSPKIIKICKGKTFALCRKKLNKKFNKLHNSKLNKINITAINTAWKSIEKEYFNRLRRIMKKPICSKKFIAYSTSVQRCPYNYNKLYFYFCFFNGIPSILHTAGHELMHIQFHHIYWKEIEEQIGYNKTSDLKEALTVLLNLEFRDLWFVPDMGYPNHTKLREFIKKEWKKKKDFNILLNKCIKHLKKNAKSNN